MIERLRRLVGGDTSLRERLDRLRVQRDDLRERLQAATTLARAGGFHRLDAYRERVNWEGAAELPPFVQSPPSLAPPPPGVAFVTVASARFVPGLEAMLRSLLVVYPGLAADIHVFHDGSLSGFVQRRLARIHDRLIFSTPDMSWLGRVPETSTNRRRIGAIGYMNVMALGLEGYDRLVVLDSDMLILGGLAPLWEGEGFVVCPDIGERPYAVRSPATGDIVLNSGVIGVPGHETGHEPLEAMKRAVHDFAASPSCATLDHFADQKIWNLYLKDKPKAWAPVNLNCNAKYLARWLGGDAEAVSILHFTGPKPWDDRTYLPADLTDDEASTAPYPRLWTDTQRRHARAGRLAAFAGVGASRGRADACALGADIPGCETMALAGGPLQASADHLILTPDFLGGWNTQTPALPAGFVESLADRRPTLWAPFYFRDYLDLAGLDGFTVNWLLIEDPFRRFVDQIGRYDPDPTGFLDDARSDLLTFGIPAALALGARRIVLPPAPAGGRERFAYEYVEKALARLGIETE